MSQSSKKSGTSERPDSKKPLRIKNWIDLIFLQTISHYEDIITRVVDAPGEPLPAGLSQQSITNKTKDKFMTALTMKKYILSCVVATLSLLGPSAFAQTAGDSTLLGLPGDNLDLYAVLDLFQKSKTIEEFEKSLNLEKTGINNLDLDVDNKVDFIKVVTKNEGDDFTFILQVAVSKSETQDVAAIFVTKDENKKINMQIVGDEDLYGKNYIVDLKESKTPAVTANPGYTGPDTVVVSAPAKTTVVVVESAPIVQYVYSPAYVPYYPPYHYGYYPPYFAAFSVMAIGIYIGHHSYYHHHGYGYHGNTTVIHNTNNFNNYNNSRNRSNTVNHNKANGNYNRASTRQSTRPSAGTSNRPSAGTSDRSANRASTRQSPVVRQTGGASVSDRSSNGLSQSRTSSTGASRYSGGSRGGGGYSGGGGGSRGGGFSGGGSRGGGGRRR